MNTISATRTQYENGELDKPAYISKMYALHHHALFEYAEYLPRTNIKTIEIEDGQVILTSRNRGVRIACIPGDPRIAPIESLNFLDYEKDESDMMENLVSEGDNFFDVGANVGWYSINIAVARRSARVFCFEPIPTTFEHLQANLRLNPSANIIAHNFGFSDRKGEFTFYCYPGGSVNASSANLTGRTDVSTVQCALRTIDDYVAETGTRVDFIKCDVEGAELLVFKGAKQTIATHKPVVCSEILRKWSSKFNYDPNDIFELFRQLGYNAYTVKGGHLSTFAAMNDLTVETNFFFLHTAKHREYLRRYAQQNA